MAVCCAIWCMSAPLACATACTICSPIGSSHAKGMGACALGTTSSQPCVRTEGTVCVSNVRLLFMLENFSADLLQMHPHLPRNQLTVRTLSPHMHAHTKPTQNQVKHVISPPRTPPHCPHSCPLARPWGVWQEPDLPASLLQGPDSHPAGTDG